MPSRRTVALLEIAVVMGKPKFHSSAARSVRTPKAIPRRCTRRREANGCLHSATFSTGESERQVNCDKIHLTRAQTRSRGSNPAPDFLPINRGTLADINYWN